VEKEIFHDAEATEALFLSSELRLHFNITTFTISMSSRNSLLEI
jgi:hypothetical protein